MSVHARPARIFCKPPMWCKTERTHWRNYYVKKKANPERREKIRELLQVSNIGSMADIQNLFKETIEEFMENGLEAESDEELGYSKYDYKNKEGTNSRNEHSQKTLKTSFGNIEIETPRDRNGEFEPQLIRKNEISISRNIEEKIISMYAVRAEL